MNEQAVKTEIEKIVSTNKNIRRQYPVARHQEKTLTELGIINLMPVGYGYTDAAKVIEAAQDAGKEFVNNFDDVTKTDASTLYALLNEPEADEPVDPKSLKIGQEIEILVHMRYQTLKDGAVIVPSIPHDRAGYKTTIRAIFTDEMEDEHGNPVIEYTIEAETGEQFNPSEIRIL